MIEELVKENLSPPRHLLELIYPEDQLLANIKDEISQERLIDCIDSLREQIAFYREYPDIFIDDIKGPDCVFKFRNSQRIYLRSIMRHKYVYCVFTRGFSKSFLAVMGLMIKAILFPGSQLFVTTGGKEQAALITISKVEEICRLIPALEHEINFERGVSKKSKDNVKYVFKNGSTIDILAARESTRGQRRTGGVIEECILVDETALNEIIIPTTNVDRLLPDGSTDPKEVVNQSQTYVTSAGWKNSFSYDKLIEILISSVVFPDQYMILGGDYKLAILEGAVKEDMVDEMKLNGTYNEASFDREYGSIWSGGVEDAFYSLETFEKHRILLQPEHEYSARSSKSAYYVLGVDIGRYKCTTEVAVIKVTPQPQGDAIKTCVNFYSKEGENFEEQSLFIKKLYYKYKARQLVVDGNGIGAAIADDLVKAQIDPSTGETLPPFVIGGYSSEEMIQEYKKYRTDDAEKDAVTLIKANAPLNTEAYTYLQAQLSSGKIKFLIDESTAKAKLSSTKVGQNMTPDERNEYLMPFQLTSNLRDEMLNLVQDNEGTNIILKQYNRGIKKDRFSALIYALYYIKLEESRKRKRKTRDIASLLFMN